MYTEIKVKTNYRRKILSTILLGTLLISVSVLNPFLSPLASSQTIDESSSTNGASTLMGERIIIDYLSADEPEEIISEPDPANVVALEPTQVAQNESQTSGSAMHESQDEPLRASTGSSLSVFADSPYVTIHATKIVCRNPQDLPRWHAGADITSNTATEYVATHPNCWLGSGWNFQWGFGEKNNPLIGPGGVRRIPGTFLGEADGSFGEGTHSGTDYNDWKTFGVTNNVGVASVEIPDIQHAARIWVREVQKSGYIPFVDEHLQDNRPSAQMWCHTDVLTYDNFDFIRDPEMGRTYYCVAFNAIDPSIAGPTITLTANPTEVEPGSSSTLTWSSENASSCTSSEFDTMGATSGSSVVTPQIVPLQTITYNISCVNSFELASTAHVTITGLASNGGNNGNTATTTPQIVTLTANPTEIEVGGSSTLTWDSQNSISCTSLEFNTNGAVGGNVSVTPGVSAGQSKNYNISCLNSIGTVTTAQASVSVIENSGGGGGSSSGGGSSRRSSKNRGQVLGLSETSLNPTEPQKNCSYLRDFLRVDWKNDPLEVMKLQSFLKNLEDLDVDINGVFDKKTFTAVGVFQEKNKSEVLTPWGYKNATSFVYITTRNKINEIYCNKVIPLTPADKLEIDSFRNSNISLSMQVKDSMVSIDKNSLLTLKLLSMDSMSNSPKPNEEMSFRSKFDSIFKTALDRVDKNNSIGHITNMSDQIFMRILFSTPREQNLNILNLRNLG